MLDEPKTSHKLHARIANEVAKTTARASATREELIDLIVGSRKLIAESRELMARADVVLAG